MVAKTTFAIASCVIPNIQIHHVFGSILFTKAAELRKILCFSDFLCGRTVVDRVVTGFWLRCLDFVIMLSRQANNIIFARPPILLSIMK